MTELQVKIDSGILQFAPKGSYYEDENEQLWVMNQLWSELLNHDRTLFCLLMLLNGTGYSKGSMSHLLLSNPINQDAKAVVPSGLSFDYETRVIRYNLYKEKTPRALKNLLMLAGNEGKTRVNNSRTRKLIIDYIFNRDHKSLDSLAINFKGKLKKLITHALGKYDLHKILSGDEKLFQKWIGRVNPNAMTVLCYLFDVALEPDKVYAHFQKIQQVQTLKQYAQVGDVEKFKGCMKGLPYLTVLGYRNTYKLDIEPGDIMEGTKISTKQSIQMQSASKRKGAEIKVDYKKQNIYDLYKLLYHKLQTQDYDDIDKLEEGIEYVSENIKKLDIGPVYIVLDASRSMTGNEKRFMHPFLTSLSIITMIENMVGFTYVGGRIEKVTDTAEAIIPTGSSPLWKGLAQAIEEGAKRILVISDGYENTLKGMFDHIYKHYKESGYDFELLHINPVMAADGKTGTTRKLTEDVEPIPVAGHEYLETEIIFRKMVESPDMVKSLLTTKFNELIGGA
jgi:hypothetical protein